MIALAPACALAEPCLVGEQNALGFGVWARCADLMRVLRSQISTPRLVVKPCPQKVCKARIPPLPRLARNPCVRLDVAAGADADHFPCRVWCAGLELEG